MPNEQPISDLEYSTRLEAQKDQALVNANELIRRQLDYMAELAKGEHVLTPMNIIFDDKHNLVLFNDPVMKAYNDKANELTREFGKLANQEDRAYLLNRQELIFSNWQRRLEVILDLNGKDNKDPNLDEIKTKGAALIRSISIPQFMAQNLKGPLKEAYIQELKSRGETLVPDFTETLTRLGGGEIKEEDWGVIIANLDALSQSNGQDWMEVSAAMGLVGAIPPRFRTELLRRLVDKPDYEHIVLRLLTINYVTTAQVEAVLNEQIQAGKAQGKSTTNLEILLVKAMSEATAIEQETAENIQEAGMERISKHKQVGHRNSMRETLTFSGILGSLVAINGAATVAANLIMDIQPKNWANIPDNPALWMGLGMLGGGLELNNGFGGMMDKPSTQLGQLLESKDEIQARKDLMSQNAFEREVMRYPRVQDLYFQFLEEINAAYSKKTKETHNPQVSLTMEEMQIDWSALPPEFKTMKKSDVEAFISQWVSRLAGTSARKQSIDSQRLFIGGDPSNVGGKKSDCRVKYGLAKLEAWKPEVKEKYTL